MNAPTNRPTRWWRQPATALAFVALLVAVGGTAISANAGSTPEAGGPEFVKNDRVIHAGVGKAVSLGANPQARAARAIGTKNLVLRAATSTIPPNRAGDADFGTTTIAVQCGPGEVALSPGSNFPSLGDGRDAFLRYVRLTTSGRGTPTGAIGSAGSDENVVVTFQVFVLCSAK